MNLRIEQLTFTRFLAAISIVVFHYGQKSFLFNNDYVSFIFKQADLGVSYFFTLSGFVMIIAYGKFNKIDFLSFIKNRLARIFPLYFLAILIIILNRHFINFSIFEILLNLLFFQTWIPGFARSLYGPNWSLSVEFFFYLLFPILYNKFYTHKHHLKKMFLYVLLFWILSQIIYLLARNQEIEFFIYDYKEIKYLPILHLNEFLIGNIAGLFYLSLIKNNKNFKNYTLHLLFVIVLLIVLLKFPFGIDYHNGFLSIIFSILILLLALDNGKISKFFQNKMLIFLGEISYGIYVFQEAIWMVFSDSRFLKYLHLSKVENYTLLFLIRVIILIVFSSFTYFYIETYFRDKIRNINLKNFLKNNNEQ